MMLLWNCTTESANYSDKLKKLGPLRIPIDLVQSGMALPLSWTIADLASLTTPKMVFRSSSDTPASSRTKHRTEATSSNAAPEIVNLNVQTLMFFLDKLTARRASVTKNEFDDQLVYRD